MTRIKLRSESCNMNTFQRELNGDLTCSMLAVKRVHISPETSDFISTTVTIKSEFEICTFVLFSVLKGLNQTEQTDNRSAVSLLTISFI